MQLEELITGPPLPTMQTRAQLSPVAFPTQSLPSDDRKHNDLISTDDDFDNATIDSTDHTAHKKSATSTVTPLKNLGYKPPAIGSPAYPPEDSKVYSKDNSTRAYWGALPTLDIVNPVTGNILVTRLGGILWREKDMLIMDRTFWSLSPLFISFFLFPLPHPCLIFSFFVCVCAGMSTVIVPTSPVWCLCVRSKPRRGRCVLRVATTVLWCVCRACALSLLLWTMTGRQHPQCFSQQSTRVPKILPHSMLW